MDFHLWVKGSLGNTLSGKHCLLVVLFLDIGHLLMWTLFEGCHGALTQRSMVSSHVVGMGKSFITPCHH